MAVLPILEFPDPRLRTVAKPVTLFDAELKSLVADMRETMYAAEGIGLAASQVDVHRRILVIDVSETKDSPRAYINPTFEVIDEELQDYDEGCLSVPGFYETVSDRGESLSARRTKRVFLSNWKRTACLPSVFSTRSTI